MNKTPDHDQLGFCAFCHIEVADWPEVNGNKILKWRNTRRESLFKLSNDSVLHVTLCDVCDQKVLPKHYRQLMDSIIGGWKKELEFTTMNTEQRDQYKKVFFKLTIEERI